jgi:hypothetical protein
MLVRGFVIEKLCDNTLQQGISDVTTSISGTAMLVACNAWRADTVIPLSSSCCPTATSASSNTDHRNTLLLLLWGRVLCTATTDEHCAESKGRS